MTEQQVDILLVEDNPQDAEMTIRALKKHNLANSVHHAKDGAEALDYLFGRPNTGSRPQPKVVLLDLKLPRVDGLDVLERLRQNPRTRTLPVVVLTSSREEPDILRAYKLGANSYIVKPVEFDSFVKAVSEAGLYWLLLNHPPR